MQVTRGFAADDVLTHRHDHRPTQREDTSASIHSLLLPSDHQAKSMDNDLTENTRLLPSKSNLPEEHASRPSEYTPLPHVQITTVALIRACEALSTFSIQPFINQVSSRLRKKEGRRRSNGSLVRKGFRCHRGRRPQSRVLCWVNCERIFFLLLCFYNLGLQGLCLFHCHVHHSPLLEPYLRP
jgi:hypothetical protein